MQTSDFKQLRVWQESRILVREVYLAIKSLPHAELYGLSDQIRRCAVSIPSNIAEGQARDSEKEFSRFLAIARGSAAELETQLILCLDLGLLQEETVTPIIEKVHNVNKMIRGLRLALERKNTTNNVKRTT